MCLKVCKATVCFYASFFWTREKHVIWLILTSAAYRSWFSFSVDKSALTEFFLICRCLTILNSGAPLALCDGGSRISNFSGYFMTPSNFSHGTTLPEPTLNTFHTRTPVSSYSKLLSKLMPSHLILMVLDGLAAT